MIIINLVRIEIFYTIYLMDLAEIYRNKNWWQAQCSIDNGVFREVNDDGW